MSTSTQVAFITGGNRGLGLETARGLGQQKIHVVIGVRDLKKGEEAVKQLASEGVSAEAVHFDALDYLTHQQLADYLDKKFGKLDILVNNAGVALGGLFGNDSSTVSQDVLRQTFDVNFFSPIALTQTLLPLIKKAPAGRIVNLASILGSLGVHQMQDSPIAAAKELAYNASKTALNAFTVHLADELKDTSIKVNSAHPGWVKTEMGGPEAPMELADGGKTSVALATLPQDGPTGGFFHMGESLPW